MALFRKGLPKRAVAGAFIGFLFGVLYMPTGGTREFLIGAGWVVLAVSLLFGRPISYYTYVAWSLLWMAWRGVAAFRGQTPNVIAAVIEVLIPLASIALLSGSGYLEAVRPADQES
jgi:hypothetical protein